MKTKFNITNNLENRKHMYLVSSLKQSESWLDVFGLVGGCFNGGLVGKGALNVNSEQLPLRARLLGGGTLGGALLIIESIWSESNRSQPSSFNVAHTPGIKSPALLSTENQKSNTQETMYSGRGTNTILPH